MKQTKLKTHSAKHGSKLQHAAKRRVQDTRPLHRSIAFHPIDLFFLLCVGVVLTASTFSAAAASYSVNGEVLAPIPTAPAVITSPTSNQQLSPQTITVSGTCPTNTYVEVADNSTLAGIAICDQNNTFQVSISLTSGLNVLTAQDYNVTNNPGPSSPSVDVYYFPPLPPSNPNTPPPPSQAQPAYVPPEVLKILQLDNGIPFNPNIEPQIVNYKPTLTGIAPPFSLVLITVHTNPYYCHTYANAQGYWSCAFSELIPPGNHTIEVTARTQTNQTLAYPAFPIKVVAAAPQPPAQSSKFYISTSYSYQVYELNKPVSLHLHVNGGVPPFAFTVTWGDGTISTYVAQSNTDFSIAHTYTILNESFGSLPVKIAAVDTKGDFSSLQIAIVLRNAGYSAASTSNPPGSSFFAKFIPWLTILWPGYLIVLLLVFSFWLGERQEEIALLHGKKLPSRPFHRVKHGH